MNKPDFKIKKDIDSIKKSINNIDKTLALQHQSLVEHIKRTELLERKIEPVEKHVEQIRGVVKFAGFLTALASALAAYIFVR